MSQIQEALQKLDLFSKYTAGKLMVFDTETNGLSSSNSVLSISALKFDFETDDEKITFSEDGSFQRFYFSREEYNPIAIECNGLTKEKITELRGGATYPEYQSDDPAFEEFCKDVDLFVAHNISFDQKFFKFMENEKKFCTMRNNTNVMRLSFPSGKTGFKAPTLEEAAHFYSIPFDTEKAHTSEFDTKICFQIFSAMVDNFKM
jgi:DNA polymerase III epsilon subunit-like protein